MMLLFCTMGLWRAGAPPFLQSRPLIPQLCLMMLTAPQQREIDPKT